MTSLRIAGRVETCFSCNPPKPSWAALVEGFGWGGACVTTPRDAIDALAVELVGSGVEILFDDLGRRSVDRDTARRLFDERAAAEARRSRPRCARSRQRPVGGLAAAAASIMARGGLR